MRKSKYIIFILWLMCSGLSAKFTTDIRSWSLPRPLGLVDSQRVDTSFVNFPMRNMVYDYSISSAYNGNLVSPIQSRIWFDRQEEKTDFLFAQPYLPYIITADDLRFYQTNTPFSRFTYKRSFTTYREENDLHFLFTGNVTRKTNVGILLNYINAIGSYEAQAGKLFNGAFFGSYLGTHYKLNAAFAFSRLRNYENGGIANPEDLGDDDIGAADLAVNLNAVSGIAALTGYLNHAYSICVEKEVQVKYTERDEDGILQQKDSIRIDYLPVTTFSHIFEVNNASKRYIEHTAEQGFYEHVYRNHATTRDTSRELSVNNTLAVTFNEEFNTKLKFGATIFARNECVRYSYAVNTCGMDVLPPFGNNINDITKNYAAHTFPDSILAEKWTNNTFVGGALYKNLGRIIHYGFDGEVCLIGYKLGEFNVKGHLQGDFKIGKDTMKISAKAHIKNKTPDYFLNHYLSNHYIWENDFEKTYRYMIQGGINYSMQWLKTTLDAGFENITNYIYFWENQAPAQYADNIQVLSGTLTLDFTTPWVNFENKMTVQHSTSSFLSLPLFASYHNLYYHGTWFKALDTQFGVDMHYFTKYYAPVLNPALGQFAAQKSEKVGNYPLLDVYANVYLKKIRLGLFLRYSHFNRAMMRHANYFSMPDYPYNPDIFRAGLSWHFYK